VEGGGGRWREGEVEGKEVERLLVTKVSSSSKRFRSETEKKNQINKKAREKRGYHTSYLPRCLQPQYSASQPQRISGGKKYVRKKKKKGSHTGYSHVVY
jgi:hypothetical protein